MKELQKRILSIIITMLLLPYIITLFISGQDISTYTSDNVEEIITVEIDDKSTKLNINDYILGILAKEIPLEYDIEAMKAQAIIVRTRLYKGHNNEDTYIYTEEYFTYEDIIKKWHGYDATGVYSNLKSAVESTQGLVVAEEGVLVITPYHLQNSGETRSGENGLDKNYAHLQSVECRLDITGVNASSKKIIKFSDLTQKMESDVAITFDDINILTTAEDGYVTELSVGGKVITAEQFRQLYQLNSTVLSLQEVDDSSFQVTTRGSGHGIGLSQNTAHFMALEGKEYSEILKYFYYGIEIKDIKEIMDYSENIE